MPPSRARPRARSPAHSRVRSLALDRPRSRSPSPSFVTRCHSCSRAFAPAVDATTRARPPARVHPSPHSHIRVTCACACVAFCSARCRATSRSTHDEEECARFAAFASRRRALATRDIDVVISPPSRAKAKVVKDVRERFQSRAWDERAYARTLLRGMVVHARARAATERETNERLRVEIVGATTKVEWRMRRSFVILLEHFARDVEIAFIGVEIEDSERETVVRWIDGKRCELTMSAHRGTRESVWDRIGESTRVPDFIVAFNAGLEVYPEWRRTIEDVARLHVERSISRDSTKDADSSGPPPPPFFITDFHEEAARRAALFLKHVLLEHRMRSTYGGRELKFIEPYVNPFRSSYTGAPALDCTLPTYANCCAFGFIGFA